MEEHKLQALHDALCRHRKSEGLGTSTSYSWTATSELKERNDGLPSNALYAYFLKEGSYDANAQRQDGDGRTIKRNFGDCEGVEDEFNESKKRRKEKRKEEKKAKRKAEKLAAKKAAKLEEKKRLRRESANQEEDKKEKRKAEKKKPSPKPKKQKVNDSEGKELKSTKNLKLVEEKKIEKKEANNSNDADKKKKKKKKIKK
mmetsp:Transcript_13792/g.21022  ORF Transcript_13792/g.21022 Transcript_13792/m.21022 type:complete len:201 (+) Transcript_13792:95-697(+)